MAEAGGAFRVGQLRVAVIELGGEGDRLHWMIHVQVVLLEHKQEVVVAKRREVITLAYEPW